LTFLYIALFIVTFVIILFCIRVVFYFDYNEIISFRVKWLFLEYQIYPAKKKIEKEKNTETKNETHKETKKSEKKKRINPIKSFYENQGFGGVIELIENTAAAVSTMLKRVIKSIVINELDISMKISSEDSAKTAIQYGKICAITFPAISAICSSVKVKKHDIDIRPDFMESSSNAKFHVVISIVPINITNAALILACQLLFKVLLKLFWGSRKAKYNQRIFERRYQS
jgi:hypothetical protein